MAETPTETRTTAGVVVERLPNALFRIQLDGHRFVVAHIRGGVRRNFVRVLVGDHVLVELSRVDVTRGRIIQRVPRT